MASPLPTANRMDVAEALLRLLADRGVDRIFGNVGSDFPPVIEALARGARDGTTLPAPIMVPHENVVIAMAHGYYMASGRLPAVALHVGQGTANALNGIINAAHLNIPLLILAGRTPTLECEVPGGRNNYINWGQEMFDQAGMVRQFVKWEYELRDARQLEGVMDRAIAIAMSEPRGPVYLTLPREVLAGPMTGDMSLGSGATIRPSEPAHAPDAALQRLSDWLGAAERPLAITSSFGRTAAEAEAFRAFVEHFAMPAVIYRPRYMALATVHPLHCGYDATPMLPKADLVLVAECDVPWIPSLVQPRDGAKIVHLGIDPLFAQYPTRGFRADLTITGDTADMLGRLVAMTPAAALEPRKAARQPWIAEHRMRPAPAMAVPDRITPAWISACIEMAKDDDTVIINEYPLGLDQVSFPRPETYYSHSPSAGLGWAMGAALGVRMAHPRRTVIATVGDGTYMFGNPTPVHFVSRAQGLPALFVIFNNARWGAVHRATLTMYPGGAAASAAEPPFSCLEPSPDYELMVRASGGWGEKVSDPAALPAAMRQALSVVREEKRQAVLNVVCDPVYVRTS